MLQYPKVYAEFQKGSFTGQKTTKRLSCIALDQVHEQENVKIKGIAGVASMIEKDDTLMQWMVVGPKVANILEDFEFNFIRKKIDIHGYHHDEGISNQISFKNNVAKLISTWDDRGNRFAEDSPHLTFSVVLLRQKNFLNLYFLWKVLAKHHTRSTYKQSS